VWLITTASLFILNLLQKVKKQGLGELCQFVQLSLYSLENALLLSFDPEKYVDDVFLYINEQSVLILPKSAFMFSDIDLLHILPGYNCDPVLTMVNKESTWDSIYLSSDPDGGDDPQPFHIFNNAIQYIVVSSIDSPVCSNIWAEIHNIVITDFRIEHFASTLGIVTTSSEQPICDQIGDTDIQISWKFRIRSTPENYANMHADVDIKSGYCGADPYPPFSCHHDRKHSPCPNDKIHIDSGSVTCDTIVSSSIFFDILLQFQVHVDLGSSVITIQNIVVDLIYWEMTNDTRFNISHDGFEHIQKYIPISDLIDTKPIEDAINQNSTRLLEKWLPSFFQKANQVLNGQQINIPF
jgi:hypothetical protein